ncbi:MAG TPA: hypothetical protein VGL58_20110 [Caulobacteraceae bacterium]|jgi:NADH:ubiquinone oxidoreductase subunit E
MHEDPNRRGVLRLAAMTTVLAGAALGGQARAAATTAKADVKYQYTPKGDDHCAVCTSFIPAVDGSGGPGTCKIVVGPIPQNGWCVLFAHK